MTESTAVHPLPGPDPGPASTPAGGGLDRAVFDRWIEAFRGPLVGFVASRVPDWGTATEVAQDAFAEAWIGRGRFEGDPADLGAAGAWLRGIALRLAAARARGGKGPRLVGAALDAMPSPTKEGDPRLDAMTAAFAELTEEQREVLRMHYLERTSAREVAALLGLTPKAVEQRVHRARADLRRRTLRILNAGGGGRDHD